MANYSKWDKFAAELSDSDEEYEENTPKVTTFDDQRGKSIEIGPQGYSVKESLISSNVNSSSGKVEVLSSAVNVNDNDLALESKNGYVCDGYSWAQDKVEVVLSIIVADFIKAKDIRLSYVEKKLRIATASGSVLLEGVLRYDVVTNAERKDDEVSDILDWEIKTKTNIANSTQTRRILEVIMRKKCPIPGAFIWWKNLFLGDAYEIDVTKISGRNAAELKATDVFVQAQKQFMEKVANMEQIEVDVGENDPEETD